MPSQSKRVKWAIPLVLAVPILLFGCCFLSGPQLDPTAVSWKKMTVEYCVGTSSEEAVMKTWETEDKKLLNDLRSALKITHQQGLSVAGYMRTNRIVITLADGKNIRMSVYTDEGMRLYNEENKKEVYNLETDGSFVKKLRNVIQDATGEPIHFYY